MGQTFSIWRVIVKRWKAAGVLALVLAVALVACKGDGAAPKETPAFSPTAGTPTPLPLTPGSRSPVPTTCEPVEAKTFETSIDVEEVLPAGKIAFLSFRDEFKGQSNREIYLVTPDGLVNLTRNSCADDEPDWSPDGTRIAWSSDREGDFEVFVMDADGGNVERLTESGGLTPRWSNDGTKIAFTKGASIVVMNADGSDPKVILESRPAARADEPCLMGGFPGGWSPDDDRVMYYAAVPTSGTELGRGYVCTVTVDGSSEVEAVVSEPPALNVEPTWSPDGRFVAFRSIRDGNSDIYVLDLDTGKESRLTDFEGLDIEPDWSPDGEWIAFGSNRDGQQTTDIYIMRKDGSDVRRLTDHEAKDSYPVWSP
jgi:Tol biopolymer transport system component